MKSELSFDERMAIEAAERLTRYAALVILARDVAANLGGSWTMRERVNDNDGNAHLDSFRGDVYIVDADGRRMDLNIEMHGSARVQRETLTIDGRYNFGDSSLGIAFPYGKAHPRIHVNMTRGAAVIAREIKRRFLPEFSAIVAEIAERVRAATEYRDKQEGIASRLLALAVDLVGAERMRRPGEREFRLISGEGNGRHAEFKVVNGVVDMKVENLTEAEAGEVLRLLAPYFAKRKGGV